MGKQKFLQCVKGILLAERATREYANCKQNGNIVAMDQLLKMKEVKLYCKFEDGELLMDMDYSKILDLIK